MSVFKIINKRYFADSGVKDYSLQAPDYFISQWDITRRSNCN